VPHFVSFEEQVTRITCSCEFEAFYLWPCWPWLPWLPPWLPLEPCCWPWLLPDRGLHLRNLGERPPISQLARDWAFNVGPLYDLRYLPLPNTVAPQGFDVAMRGTYRFGLLRQPLTISLFTLYLWVRCIRGL